MCFFVNSYYGLSICCNRSAGIITCARGEGHVTRNTYLNFLQSFPFLPDASTCIFAVLFINASAFMLIGGNDMYIHSGHLFSDHPNKVAEPLLVFVLSELICPPPTTVVFTSGKNYTFVSKSEKACH